jgi:hypothetical protein
VAFAHVFRQLWCNQTVIAQEPQLGAEPFSCPHCNVVVHQDWCSLVLKSENATDVIVLTLEAAMLAKGEDSDQFVQRLKDNVLTYEYEQHPRNLKVKFVNRAGLGNLNRAISGVSA